MQCARAEMASFLNTRPGQITRIGNCIFSIALTCTLEVCVRSRSGFGWPADTKNVSCISLAGWFGGKLSASKT